MLKKYWYLFAIALFTVGLGVVVFLTNQKLSQTASVSPTAPEGEAEAAALKACVLNFALTGEVCLCPDDETPCPNGDVGLCPESPPDTPTPTATPEDTPTPTPTATPTPTPTPTPEPTATPTPGQQSQNGEEEAPPEEIAYVQPTATPTPVPPASCDDSCTINSDCESGLVCVDGSCRNPSCTAVASCTCTGTPQPTPKTPVSGGPTILGASVIGIGMLILLLGLAL